MCRNEPRASLNVLSIHILVTIFIKTVTVRVIFENQCRKMIRDSYDKPKRQSNYYAVHGEGAFSREMHVNYTLLN
jgi:hypothetical protein